jgi:hypothetical protein
MRLFPTCLLDPRNPKIYWSSKEGLRTLESTRCLCHTLLHFVLPIFCLSRKQSLSNGYSGGHTSP